MDESRTFDFDKMTDEELLGIGFKGEKFKPVKKEEKMPSRPEGEIKMPEREVFELGKKSEEKTHIPEGEKFKPVKKEEKKEEPKEEKKEPVEGPSKEKKDMTLDELGEKIDTLLSEDEKIRSEFDNLDDDGKKRAVSRLGDILKEYNELVELINIRVSEISISESDIESMTQENIISELKSLRSKNTKLRSLYEKAKNVEVKVAIENQIDKLNIRYSSLIDAYNSKNSMTK